MVAEISLFLLFNLEQYRIKTKRQPFKGWRHNAHWRTSPRPVEERAQERDLCPAYTENSPPVLYRMHREKVSVGDALRYAPPCPSVTTLLSLPADHRITEW